MTDKEFRKLSRTDLIEIIYEYQRREQEMQIEINTLRDALEKRDLKIQEAGSIAEAVVRLNELFETAQKTADEYVEQVKKQCDAAVKSAAQTAPQPETETESQEIPQAEPETEPETEPQKVPQPVLLTIPQAAASAFRQTAAHASAGAIQQTVPRAATVIGQTAAHAGSGAVQQKVPRAEPAALHTTDGENAS